MTTFPFWLTFDGLAATQDKHGRIQVEDIKIARPGGPVKRLSGVLHSGNAIKFAPRPKYCPQCLTDDFEEFGEPFLHRAHQLPNVKVCAIHGCRLADRCGRCGSIAAPIHRDALTLARLSCRCGNALSALGEDAFLTPPIEVALAKLSADALMVRARNWDHRHVRHYIKLQLGANSWREIVQDAFGPTRRLMSGATAKVTRITAPSCALLLAAMNIDFHDAAAGFSKIAIKGTAPEKALRSKRVDLESLTIAQARSDFLQKVRRSPQQLASQANPKLYWYLRFFDSSWLHEQFPNLRPSAIPTIADDRKHIRKVVESGGSNAKNLHDRVFYCSAGTRAQIRDSDWLHEQISEFEISRENAKLENRKALKLRQRALVLQTVTRILEKKDRPKAISVPELAKTSGLTVSQIRWLMTEFADLGREIAEANANLTERTLLWAIGELEAKKEPYCKSDIYTYARRRRMPAVNSALKRVLNSLPRDAVSFLKFGQ